VDRHVRRFATDGRMDVGDVVLTVCCESLIGFGIYFDVYALPAKVGRVVEGVGVGVAIAVEGADFYVSPATDSGEIVFYEAAILSSLRVK